MHPSHLTIDAENVHNVAAKHLFLDGSNLHEKGSNPDVFLVQHRASNVFGLRLLPTGLWPAPRRPGGLRSCSNAAGRAIVSSTSFRCKARSRRSDARGLGCPAGRLRGEACGFGYAACRTRSSRRLRGEARGLRSAACGYDEIRKSLLLSDQSSHLTGVNPVRFVGVEAVVDAAFDAYQPFVQGVVLPVDFAEFFQPILLVGFGQRRSPWELLPFLFPEYV